MNPGYGGQGLEMDVRSLSKLYSLDGPFTTIYLDTSSRAEDAAEQLDVRWKNVLRELAAAGVDEATREALTAARGEHGQGNTRVLVATPGTVHLAVSLPQPPAGELVTTGNLPVLAPLADALTMQVPHVVVLADRSGADVLAYTSGPEPAVSTGVTNDRWPNRKVHAGGWASRRYDHDVEESWEASARDVAELVGRVARDVEARVVIGSGDERALQLLGQHLPTELVDRFVEVAGGGRADDGSAPVIAAEVLRVLADTLAADTVELLDDFAQQRGRDERATEGVPATVEALRRGQVATLLLTDARAEGREAFVGPDPTHLALSAQELLDLGVEQPWAAPLDEALLRAALGTAADVRFLTGGVEQAPAEGVGALLRYAG